MIQRLLISKIFFLNSILNEIFSLLHLPLQLLLGLDLLRRGELQDVTVGVVEELH